MIHLEEGGNRKGPTPKFPEDTLTLHTVSSLLHYAKGRGSKLKSRGKAEGVTTVPHAHRSLALSDAV